MAERIIPASILLRRDSAENWERVNPVLKNGEYITVITASGEIKHKSGDGVRTYKQLPFEQSSSEEIETTLLSSGWQDKKQILTVNSIISKDQNGIVGLSQTITADQYEAAATAEMCIVDQKENSITIACNGSVPQVDIPIIIILFG